MLNFIEKIDTFKLIKKINDAEHRGDYKLFRSGFACI